MPNQHIFDLFLLFFFIDIIFKYFDQIVLLAWEIKFLILLANMNLIS